MRHGREMRDIESETISRAVAPLKPAKSYFSQGFEKKRPYLPL